MTKETIATITNAAGGLVYKVLDIDYDADVMQLEDPHTGTEFLLPDCRNTLALLGYEVKDANESLH